MNKIEEEQDQFDGALEELRLAEASIRESLEYLKLLNRDPEPVLEALRAVESALYQLNG